MSRGDHIFVNRVGGIYNHHGIDCGDGTVIHYHSKTWQAQRRIERTSLEAFRKDDAISVRDYSQFLGTLEQASGTEKLLQNASNRINKMLDSLRGLQTSDLDFSADAVIARAEGRLGESRFGLVSNNCEHFAAWCKTGISSSNQINVIWKASLTGPRFMQQRTQLLLTELIESPWSR